MMMARPIFVIRLTLLDFVTKLLPVVGGLRRGIFTHKQKYTYSLREDFVYAKEYGGQNIGI
jgi:hypothetical protein